MGSDPTSPAGEAVPVTFVAARAGPAGGAGFQEWRYRTTGRVVEVAEANAYAPSSDLREGAEGFVEYRRGVPVVVRRPGDRSKVRPTPVVAPPPSARRAARRPPRPPVSPAVWVLLALLGLVIVLAWGR